MKYLGVEVERVQILSLLIGLVAIVTLHLALVSILLRVELADVQRILEVVQFVGESEKAKPTITLIVRENTEIYRRKSLMKNYTVRN